PGCKGCHPHCRPRRSRMAQQVVSFVVHEPYVVHGAKLAIEGRIQIVYGSHGILVIGMPPDHRLQQGNDPLNLLLATTGKQRDKRFFPRQPFTFPELFIGNMRTYRIEYGIAYIVYFPIGFPVKILLERKDHERAVAISLWLPDPSLGPRPDLGWYVIKYFEISGSSIPGYASVESSIVDEDHNIRLKPVDIFFALAYESGNLTQVPQQFEDSHERHLAVVDDDVDPGLLHILTSEAAERTRWIFLSQSTYQVASVQVA